MGKGEEPVQASGNVTGNVRNQKCGMVCFLHRGPGPGVAYGMWKKYLVVLVIFASIFILETHYNVLSFVSILFLSEPITQYQQLGGGGQNFLGPRVIKYLNTDLSIPLLRAPVLTQEAD
jgi:hypothetical protein